jgi:hypothetical protein
MSIVKFTAVEGKGTSLDRSEELCDAIKEVCYRLGEGAPVTMVIGCLEIAKIEILEGHRE